MSLDLPAPIVAATSHSCRFGLPGRPHDRAASPPSPLARPCLASQRQAKESIRRWVCQRAVGQKPPRFIGQLVSRCVPGQFNLQGYCVLVQPLKPALLPVVHVCHPTRNWCSPSAILQLAKLQSVNRSFIYRKALQASPKHWLPPDFRGSVRRPSCALPPPLSFAPRGDRPG